MPQAADFHEFVALVAEPEVQFAVHPAFEGNELAEVGADDDDNQCPEEQVNAEFLEFRVFTAVDNRHEEQSRGEEAGGDPEDGGLDVPGAGQAVGQPVGDRDAVEVLSFNGVVRGEAAQHDLREEQRRDD